MGFRLFHRLHLLVPLLVLVLITLASSEINVGETLNVNTPEYETVTVTQYTPVSRQRRGELFEQAVNHVEGYEFPDEMTFVIQSRDQRLVLNLTKNTYAQTNIHLSDNNGDIESDFAFRFGTYYSEESSASVLVECLEEVCTLHGSVDIGENLYHIERDQSSNDVMSHRIRKRSLPDLDQLKNLIREITAAGEKPTSLSVGSMRRRRSVVPDCDIIEVKILLDDTIWDYYLNKNGGNETLANEEIQLYFTSIFAEVDFRMKCLTSYFEAISDCGTKCLRVILVAIEITKTSSWTDGNLRTETFPDGKTTTFVKGVGGLNKCGYLNTQMSPHIWDHLVCFTMRDIIIQDSSGIWQNWYRVVSWRPSMCNSNKKYRTSVTEALGDGVDLQVVHGILHSLHAYNDEDKSCARNEFYVMREYMSLKYRKPAFWTQNWYMSDCTAPDICNYIKGLNNANNNCMRVRSGFDDAKWKEWVQTPFSGELFSTDYQCKLKFGNDSEQCDPTGEGNLFPEFMCSRYIWCSRNNSCVCQLRVASGTPCGKARICLKGSCVPVPDVPLGGTCDCHSQCADDNAVCDPDTCKCVCADGYYDNNGDDVDGGNCTEKVPNNGTCDEDRQCRDPNAQCINGTCQCIPCYFDQNGICVPQSCLGGPCNSTEGCKGDNVECDVDRNICVCETGYFVNSEGKCVRVNGTLCDPCIQNPDSCTQQGTECSDRGFCECTNDTVAVDGECYGTRVGERCTNVENTCIDDNAICNGSVCVCIEGFQWNGTICVGNDPCDPCDPSVSTCECSTETYRCVCPAGQVQIGDICYGTRVTEVCTSAVDTCIDDNAACNGTVCDCLPGFVWNGTICVGTDLCNPCDTSTVPCQSPYVCGASSFVCECPSDQVQIDGDCYGTRVTEECTTVLDTCIDDYAECNGTICDCITGFVWNGTHCVGPDLCDPCDPSPSSCDPSLVCSPVTYRCECPSDQVQIGDGCYGTRVTDPCTTVLDTCIDHNAACNGTICDCVSGFTWNGTICVGQDLCDPCDNVTQSCASPLVCNLDTYRCECPSDQVQIGGECYGTRVTEPCTTVIDTCIDDNAGCNGTVCDCLPGFAWNGSICVGQDLCDPCDPDTLSCDSSLLCSNDTYRCECPPDQVQIGDNCYGTRVTEPCTSSLDTCVDSYADCNGTICDCISGFTWNGTICVGNSLCDPCDPSNSTCASPLVCSTDTNRCECPPDQVQIGNFCYGTRVTEVCTTSLDTCIDDYAECNGTVCDCIAGFAWNGSICVGINLCNPCDNSTQSCDGKLVCGPDTNRCECPDDRVQIGNACYGTRVNEPCTNDLDTCADSYAECNGTVCVCVDGFVWNGTICVGPGLCDPCDPDVLSCNDSFVCSSDSNRCECPAGQVQVGDGCYGTHVTDPCTTVIDTCVDNYAECNGTICDCISGFVWNGTICVGPGLCDPCDPSTPSCASHLVCSSDTYRCECPDDQVQIGDYCYGTRVTEPCTTELPTCADNRAVCNGTVCVCDSPFVWNGSICVGPDLCDPCDSSTLPCGSPLVCSTETDRCECPADRVQIGDECYGTRVTEECTTLLDTCIDNYANCNGTVCDCIPGFTWSGSSCVGPDLCDPCSPSPLSCEGGLVCSVESYRCECPLGQVQIGDNCYGTRVTEPCTNTPDTCIDDNAGCNGTICDCLAGFTWNGSICVGVNLCDPCDSSTSNCSSPLVCSQDTHRCECPSDQVQIGDDCYGTHVTDPCTTVVDTCIDDYATCNGTVCDCIHKFIWNGSVCVGPDLCDPCDPSTPSCVFPLICSTDTYRCECPSDQVQIGNMCYGTRVTDACTTTLSTCIDDNAGCNGTVCDCLPGYHWNGSICVGSELCEPCDNSTLQCNGDLVCSTTTYTCECPPDQVQIGNACYGTRVTEPCTQDLPTCIDDYAECNGTVCNCISGFIWNGSVCVGPDLCDPCDPDTPSCDNDLVCSNDTYRCECPSNQVQIGDGCFGTLVTERCNPALDTCADNYAECNGTICDCITGFIWNGAMCVGPDLCDPCDPDTPSCSDRLVCSNLTYRCECPEDRVQIGDSCVGTRVNEVCSQILETCIDDNAECNSSNICDCKEGFEWNGVKCADSSDCSDDNDCIPPLVCSNASMCVCPAYLVLIGDTCYGRLVTEECTLSLDTCIDDNAECNGTICDCITGFTWTGSLCGGTDLCDPCDPAYPTCAADLVCNNETNRCECPSDQVQIGDACFGTQVSESCTNTIDTCIDMNANCNGSICDCVTGFTWNGSICVGLDLCDPCDPDTPSCDSSLVCSSDTYRCECPSDQVQIGDNCYGTRVTEPCTTQPDTCVDDNAMCNGTICDCIAGFTWNGTICVGTDLCDPCDSSVLPCDSPLVCSSDSWTCECPTDQVQIGDNCYGTHVTDPCTSQLDTCVDDNALCNGTICDCIPGFTWNGSLCVGTDLCDPCDSSSCQASLVCSMSTYRCECPSDRVQIGNECYGTRVTEPCTSNPSTCIDDNAECNGTICDCVSGFAWNGSICVGSDLCDPCDSSVLNCATDLICSSDTDRCECPTDQVQIGDMCYGTRVTESCTTTTDTCIDTNADCNGTVCDCVSGFVWNGSICVGSAICDLCDNSTLQCGSGLVCNSDTDRCECPPGQVQIGDDCYGTRLSEPCTTTLNTCIDDRAACNGTICDCVPGYTWNGTICVGSELCDPCDSSVLACDSSLVCSSDTNRCECPAGQVQIGDDCYGRLVTEPCTSAVDTCIDMNADCNGTICDCVSGFTWNGSICVGTELCDPCDSNVLPCASPLVCSPDTDRCECPSDRVQIGDECYGTVVTEPCTVTLDTCTDYYAVCNGTVCDCIPGFTWNGSICVGPELCDPCDPLTASCGSPLVCSSDTYRCECPPGHVQIGNECYGTRVGDDCTTDLSTCIDHFAECNSTVCNCIAGFIWNGSICVGPDLCDPCDPATPSCGQGLECGTDTNRCECADGYVQIGDSCYGRQVTEPCRTDSDTCIDDNAQCNGTVCDCVSPFVWNGSICVGPDLCNPCDSSTLACSSPLVCSADTDRCECPADQVQIGDACYGTRVTESCTTSPSTCIDAYAECNGTVCDCITGFIWNGSICVGPDLCDPCDPSTPSCASPLVCSSDTYRCECPSDQVQIGDACYGTRVTEPCTSPDTCSDDNARCNGTICDCLPGFTWTGTLCVAAELCGPCDPSDSSCTSPLVCSNVTNRCECPSGQVQIGNECYGRHISEHCTTSEDTCIDDNAGCNGTVCVCDAGFIYNGSICVGPELCDPCDPSTLNCTAPLTCSPTTYRCECPTDEVQIGNGCYGTRVTESCTTTLDTCIDTYADCNGTVCDCISGFTWNGSVCVGTELCDPCDSDSSTCSDPLVCSSDTNRCECPSDRVQIGDTCYGTRVTEPCTQSVDTCVDDYAVCNGTICNCISGYVWNGTVCVGSSLCDPCDSDTLSCGTDLVCSATTDRCECASDRVQIEDGCYGTRINETCLSSVSTCVDNNAQCSGGVCACIPPFTWNATLQLCVGINLDDPCDEDSCSSGLACGATSQRCECETPAVQIDNVCYGTRIGEDCTTAHDTCIDNNAECAGGKCSCITNFTWNGVICVGKNLDDPCDNSSSSCAANGLVCGSGGRCECPDGEVQVDNMCYSLICGSCVDDSDCLGNQVCNQSECQCPSGQYLDNCGDCQTEIANGGNCTSDEQCVSNICACNVCIDSLDDDCCEDCESIQADIIVVTDNSGPSEAVYKDIRDFALTLTNSFTVSSNDVQIGLVDYDSRVNDGNSFNLDELTNNFEISAELVSNGYQGVTTRRTHRALNRAYTYFTSSANRAGVPNYVVVLLGGDTCCQSSLSTSVTNLKGLPDMTIYSVAFASVSSSELELIASDNSKAFSTADSSTLEAIVTDILANSCGTNCELIAALLGLEPWATRRTLYQLNRVQPTEL